MDKWILPHSCFWLAGRLRIPNTLSANYNRYFHYLCRCRKAGKFWATFRNRIPFQASPLLNLYSSSFLLESCQRTLLRASLFLSSNPKRLQRDLPCPSSLNLLNFPFSLLLPKFVLTFMLYKSCYCKLVLMLNDFGARLPTYLTNLLAFLENLKSGFDLWPQKCSSFMIYLRYKSHSVINLDCLVSVY